MAIPAFVLILGAFIAVFRNAHAQQLQATAKIYEVQGASHTSPLKGSTLSVTGVVTAVASRGFYLQDPSGDGNAATSDAVFVFTSSKPDVKVADKVLVSGLVSEFIPGGPRTANLATTQIVATESSGVSVLSSDNSLPEPVVIGTQRTAENARLVPTGHIDDDAFTSFDVATDALDFYESLEGMLVTLRDPVTVSTTSRVGELWVVPDNGKGSDLGPRGALPIEDGDFNPERIQIDVDKTIFDTKVPDMAIGTRLSSVTGVLSYNYGSYEVIPTRDFMVTKASTLEPMTTQYGPTARFSPQVKVATLNTLNLDPTDGVKKYAQMAAIIVRNLRKPDIVALQEIQDANGKEEGGTISAALTLQLLVNAISRDTSCTWLWPCPTYAFLDNSFIADNTSGGQPGANIRTAYLYRVDRLEVVPGSVNSVVDAMSQQTDKANPFYRSRLPLAVRFRQLATSRSFEMINVHFSSKGGSKPLFGALQPADKRQEDALVNGSVDRRVRQARAVRDYIAAKPAAERRRVIVTGDFNEFEFVSPLKTLETTGLTLMTKLIPRGMRYSYIFKGNAQVLDHFLVGEDFAESAKVEIVHTNTEFPHPVSDHDPVVALFTI